MIFSDLWFAGFLPCLIFAVWFAPAQSRKVLLLFGCMLFHGHYAGPAGVLPIAFLASLVFLALRSIRRLRVLAILICILALLHYKYSSLLNSLLGWELPIQPAPLAISFFVFEFIHQLVDRNLGRLKADVRPLDFALFVIFFPSLAAGPIKRYQEFIPELSKLGRPKWIHIGNCLVRILIGYFKKFCIGDLLASEVPGQGQLLHWQSSLLLLALLQGIRIFLDFSGYSDIAIGFAGLLNIRLPENFSFPYLAHNLSEFWRRWHISLSTWIRDYIYILLGGNRVSNSRRAMNLLGAMVLCGLWHGAAGHFAVWGLLHGLALWLVYLWGKQQRIQLPRIFSWGLTFIFIQISWLTFFYDLQELVVFWNSRPLL